MLWQLSLSMSGRERRFSETIHQEHWKQNLQYSYAEEGKGYIICVTGSMCEWDFGGFLWGSSCLFHLLSIMSWADISEKNCYVEIFSSDHAREKILSYLFFILFFLEDLQYR